MIPVETKRTLTEIAWRYPATDKGPIHHNYTPIYDRHFNHLRHTDVTLLELGIGGEDNPQVGGASLLMWEEYFQWGRIYGLDLYDKSFLNGERIRTFKGSQDDEKLLVDIIRSIGRPDIIIDDASHVNIRTVNSFRILFPRLECGGMYVIEDVESSWWEAMGFGGTSDPDDFKHPSAINLGRQLLNDLNWQVIPHGEQVRKFDIASVHFYKNLIVIEKGNDLSLLT